MPTTMLPSTEQVARPASPTHTNACYLRHHEPAENGALAWVGRDMIYETSFWEKLPLRPQ